MNICDNVNLSVFKTDKFNSISMSISFVLPALEYTTTGNNLLAGMFFEGCEKYKTPKKIYTRLEEIGAEAHSSVVKKGDYSILVLYCKFRAEYTKDALESVILGLREQGYELVPVSELIYKENYHLDVTGRQIKNKWEIKTDKIILEVIDKRKAGRYNYKKQGRFP